MRDYLITTRKLVAGEEVDYQGEVITLKGAKLAINPSPRTPVPE
jgi:alkanesulfonate monooxygenase SsuD/methylene tetrahydromethanopterin reductase-like flavin-dependent oxidoreductase (luciferase family)